MENRQIKIVRGPDPNHIVPPRAVHLGIVVLGGAWCDPPAAPIHAHRGNRILGGGGDDTRETEGHGFGLISVGTTEVLAAGDGAESEAST